MKFFEISFLHFSDLSLWFSHSILWWAYKFSKCVFLSYFLFCFPYKLEGCTFSLCTPRMCTWWGGGCKFRWTHSEYRQCVEVTGHFQVQTASISEKEPRDPLNKKLFWTLWMRSLRRIGNWTAICRSCLLTTPIEQTSLCSSCHVYWLVFPILSSAANRA
jgi:hypothetical protein